MTTPLSTSRTTCANRFRPNTAARGECGATFIEVTLATVIISTTIVGAMSSMARTAEAYHFFADGPHEALMLAQEIHEAALTLPWIPVPGEDDLFGDDVDEVMDLDAQVFDPARSAEYEVVFSHSNWRQEVEARYVDPNLPDVEIQHPESHEGELLIELSVTVFEGDHEMGAFKWWVSEPEEG